MAGLTNREKVFAAIILILMIVLCGTIYINKNNDNELDFMLNEEISSQSSALEETSPKEIVVYIAGQVKNPGLVRIEEGKRLGEVIDMVGGLLEDADIVNVNLAQKLIDEQMVYIPKKGETIENETSNVSNSQISASTANTASRKININTAGIAELETLPGIGPKYAQGIIDYRNKNGSFKNIEEIKQVKGIGDKRYEEIKDLITVK